MSNPLKFAIAAAVVLVIAVAVIFLEMHRSSDMPAQAVSTTTDVGTPGGNPAATDGFANRISQADHDSFIATAIPSCQKTAAQNPKIMNAGFPPDAVEKYCRCVAEKSADVITQNELTYIAQQKLLPASFETKTRDIAAGLRHRILQAGKITGAARAVSRGRSPRYRTAWSGRAG